MLARSLLLNVARWLQFISQSRLKPIAQYRVTVLAVSESPEQVLNVVGGSEFLRTTEPIHSGLYAQHTRRVVALVEAAAFLSKLIYDRISGSCEIIFGDSIAGLREAGAEVHVQFEHGGERRFDLVIGADGLHSRVRKLVFGPQDRTRRTSAIASRHSKPPDIGRATSSFTSSIALPAGRSVVLPSTTTERCFCSYSQAEASRSRTESRRKRRSCARYSRVTAGSCLESLGLSIPAMTFISIASVRSAWLPGRVGA